ncbi:hypothetical protein GE061_018531, partial [Apolygus lucorum]
MGWFNVFVSLALVASSSLAIRPIDDHVDSGKCLGEFTEGNSPFVPERYFLFLDLNSEEKNFRGNLEIHGTLSGTVEHFSLHSVNLNVSQVILNQTEAKWAVDSELGILNITLPDGGNRGKNDFLAVQVNYDGVFNDNNGVIMQQYDENDAN